MQNGRGAGEDRHALLAGDERGIGDSDSVFAQRDRIELELPGGVGQGGLRVVRSARFENHFYVRDRAVLWIMNDTADAAKDRGEGTRSRQKKNCEQQDASHGNSFSLKWLSRAAGCRGSRGSAGGKSRRRFKRPLQRGEEEAKAARSSADHLM